MLSGLQFSSLIRAGFGVCLELSTFLRSCVRSRSALRAENLFLRKQLAFYQEHQVRPRRLTDAARISLVLWSKFCDWRSALVIVKPETLIACDFLVVVTAGFRQLYVFVLMEIGARRIVYCNVTAHSTAAWTVQQFREALPSNHCAPQKPLPVQATISSSQYS